MGAASAQGRSFDNGHDRRNRRTTGQADAPGSGPAHQAASGEVGRVGGRSGGGGGRGRRRRRRSRGPRRRGEDGVRRDSGRRRRKENPGHQGRPRVDRSRAQGSQGPRGRRSEGGEGEGHQGGSRGHEEEARGAGRHRSGEVALGGASPDGPSGDPSSAGRGQRRPAPPLEDVGIEWGRRQSPGDDMAGTIQCGRRGRKDFGKIPSIVEIPNLIEVQKRSYESFLQKDVPADRREEAGLQAVFKSVFPIADYNDNALLEFDSYHFGDPKYTVEECHDRGMTFAIPLKVTLRLVVFDHDKEAKTRTIREQRGQEVYLGELPLMTNKGTFIINGTERVVVSQLQRSAGVFFDDDKGKTLASGKPLYSARVIPYRGSWVEFDFDANDILQVRVDRRRKMLATAYLRAFWFLEKGVILSDEEILAQFYETEEVQGFEDGNAWVKFNPDAHEGAKVAEDVKPPRHREPLITAGKVLNAKLAERLQEAGVEKIAVRAESLVGRRTASRIVDTDSGEVLVETNTEITSTVLSQVMSRPIAPFKLLVLMLPNLPNVRPGDKRTDASMYQTLARDHFKNPDEALVEIYRRLRPGDPPTIDSARALFRGMFMDGRRYDLARVGRFMINKKLGIDAPLSLKTLRSEDIVSVVRHLLLVKLGSRPTDDIDHLGNRRVRSVGELLENQFRVGLTRMERAVKG